MLILLFGMYCIILVVFLFMLVGGVVFIEGLVREIFIGFDDLNIDLFEDVINLVLNYFYGEELFDLVLNNM